MATALISSRNLTPLQDEFEDTNSPTSLPPRAEHRRRLPELNDRRNYLADDFQYRRGLADDALPVSSLLLSLNRVI
jgi:hypothetical protein